MGGGGLVEKLTHKVEHQIYVAVVLSALDVTELDDVCMPRELLEILDFTVSPLSVSCVTKGVKALLQRLCGTLLLLNHLPDDPVGTLSDTRDNFILAKHVLAYVVIGSGGRRHCS